MNPFDTTPVEENPFNIGVAPVPQTPMLPGLGGGPVPTPPPTFQVNPLLNDQPQSKALVEVVGGALSSAPEAIPRAASEVLQHVPAFSIPLGDNHVLSFNPEGAQQFSLKPIGSIPSEATTEGFKQAGVPSSIAGPLSFAATTIGDPSNVLGPGEAKGAIRLGKFTAEESRLLVKAAERISSGTLLSVPDWEAFQNVVTKAGYQVPKVQTKAAQMILDARDSAVSQAFNSSLDTSLRETPLPSKTTAQPRQLNGWWDSFKTAVGDQRGFVKNPFAGGEEKPPLPPEEPVSVPSENTNISKELQPLAQEAQKYSSAEEFVKTQGTPVFRGGLPFDKKLFNSGELRGISVSKDMETAQGFAGDLHPANKFQGGVLSQGKKGVVEQMVIDKNANILNVNNAPKELRDIMRNDNRHLGVEKISLWAEKNGYDAVDFHDFEIRVLNPDILKTKSQLTDFYNQATKNLREGQLPAEHPSPSSEKPIGEAQKTSTQLTGAGSLEELNQARKSQTSGESTTGFKYVKNEPLNISPKGTDRLTARDIRLEYSGAKNEQIVRGNQLAGEIRKAAPKEQQGMFWYKAASGDKATLESLLTNPKFAEYKVGIQSALNLSPEARAALAKGEQYYKEAGQVSKETGTIGNIRENYQNRIYKPEPPKDFVKTEMGQGLKQTTSHGKARVFDTEMQAVEAGKQFATTNYADALAIHNEEMARVNTARSLMDTMERGGLGSWTENVPGGWQQVGQLRKGGQIFAAPEGIAKGLKAISDPDFMSRIDIIRGLQKYQGLVKSVDLAFSFFHHLTFVTQTLSSKRGLTTLAQMVTGGLKMEAPAFKAMELDFVRNGGMTTHVAATQDIMRELSVGDDNIAKLLRLPIGKQLNSAIQISNKFLFEKMQRFLKVMTYQKNMASWIGSHPDATNEAVTAAKQGFAKTTNAEYGGLNWQAMGITKSEQSILRTIFLAPDWLTSAGAQTKYAFTDLGTAGQQARLTLVKAVIGGMVATEGINKMLTGHFTDKNAKGHFLEIEVAPHVYVSLIRGAPGELVKLISNVVESGGAGVARYAAGKLSPLTRTTVGALTNTTYGGKKFWAGGKHPTALSQTFGGLISILQNASPIPFSLTSGTQELKSGKATPLGVAATATGIGRYSNPGGKKATANPFSI